MKRMILMGILLLMALACFGTLIEARPTAAVTPAVTDTKDAVVLTDIYAETFDHLNDFTVFQEATGYSQIYTASNQLYIYAGSSRSSLSAKDRNFVRTRDLHYHHYSFNSPYRYGYYPVYTIETAFTVYTDCSWFIVVDNNDIVLTMIGKTLYAYVGETDANGNQVNVKKSIHTLTACRSYKIYIEAHPVSYNLYVDKNLDGKTEYIDTYYYMWSPHKDFFCLGDKGGAAGYEDYGCGMWSYFRLKGHVATDVKFFESFDDGNAQNWFYISEDTVNSNAVDNPDGMFLTSIGSKHVKDYCLEFLAGTSERRTFAMSPFIDIVKDEEYWISMDFYVRDTRTVRWFILLSDYDDVVLFLWKTGGELRLYSYTKSPLVYNKVAALQPSKWYYLEVHKHGNTYDVTLNNDPATKKTCKVNVPTNQPSRKGLRVGDFSPNDHFDQVRIDNVMVRQNLVLPQAKDIDRDNISNDFERDAFCPLFFDDFEYSLAFEEYGWQHVVLNNKGTHDEIWDVKYPVVNNGDPDAGIGFGRPSELSLDKRSRILGTKHGAAYPKDMNVLLKSPIMHMPAYNGPEVGALTTHKLMVYLWTWYDFEDGKDGGRVYIEYWDPTSARVQHPVTRNWVYQLHQVTIYPKKPGGGRGYPSSSIAALGYTSGYSGSSGKWVHQSFLVQQPELNGKYFRLVFKTRTDGQATCDWGWYIDDVKVYVSMANIWGSQYDNSDRDGDDLPDGEEFYKYGTSPMAADTDWDCIEDGLEVTDGYTWEGGKGQKFSREYGADPQVRNIFLEIDWLYDDDGWFKWDHKPYKETYDEMDEVQKNFKKHDIWFYYEFDDSIDVDHSDDTLSFTDFRRWHATPDAAHPNRSLTPDRRYIWHYTLFAHKSNKDTWTKTVRGTAYRNAYMFVIYRGSISDDQKLSGVLAHELGHNLGLFDYDSSKGYNGAKPPKSTMDYNRDDKSNDDPDYLDKNSNTWYDAKDKQFDSWGAKKWCYGGWQYSGAVRRHRTTGDDGEWTAGLSFASVLYSTPP